jgi:uncharacterized protein YodC (DUF2158 family)
MREARTVKVTRARDLPAAACERCSGKTKGDGMCDSCFVEILERRVIKKLRAARKKRHWYADEMGFAVLKGLAPASIKLEMIKPAAKKSLKSGSRSKRKPGGDSLVISSMTADGLAEQMLCRWFKAELMRKDSKAWPEVMAFCGITERELERYIKIMRIPRKTLADTPNGLQKDTRIFLDAIEKRYPGTLHAAGRSMRTISEVIHNG